MAIPGLLIEYFIVGALALIWLYPPLKMMGLDKVDISYLTLLIPGVYVIGMSIDFIALLITKPIKGLVRRWVEKRYNIKVIKERGIGLHRQVKFALYAPEVYKEVLMRSSRDRIARGALVNSILGFFFLKPMLLAIFLVLFFFILWVGFERVSYSFELIAENLVDEKNNNEKVKAHEITVK